MSSEKEGKKSKFAIHRGIGIALDSIMIKPRRRELTVRSLVPAGVDGCTVGGKLLVTKNYWKINLISSILCWCHWKWLIQIFEIFFFRRFPFPSFPRFLTLKSSLLFSPTSSSISRLSLRICHHMVTILFIWFFFPVSCLFSTLRMHVVGPALLGRNKLPILTKTSRILNLIRGTLVVKSPFAEA